MNVNINTMEQKEINLINLYNAKGEKHGLWIDYHSNGQLWYKGHYVNGKKEGYWEWYYFNGQLWWKGHFVRGEEIRGIYF